MGKRLIRKVAILGSGVMGSRIACHFANIGAEVLLLDIAPKELTLEEQAKGLKLESPAVKNRIVNASLQAAIKSNPNPLYHKSFASRIKTGNFTDHLKDIAASDWIMEVVVENLEIKKSLFTEVEKYRKPGTLITSNTSGIPIRMMCEGRSDDFKKNFCGTHFFNPPRYLPLLEIIPGPETDKTVLDFLMEYGSVYLGKRPILCKDTPAFIANRIGVFGIMALFHLVDEMGLTVEQVDKLTGPVIGRPKSATFRTCDVVGLDTLIHVANDAYVNLPEDSQRDKFKLPPYITMMSVKKWYGDKTKQGFYKKTKNEKGKTEILALNLKTLDYQPQQKTKFATLEQTKTIDDLATRLKVLVAGKDVAGEFYRKSFYGLFQYVSERIPEITDQLYKIDYAMKAGFGWEMGPFEMWDAIGVKVTVAEMEKAGYKPAQWVYDMLAKGVEKFWSQGNNFITYYHLDSGTYKFIAEDQNIVKLKRYNPEKTIWKNSGTTLTDVGDGIVNLSFHTKMNTIGGEVLQGINKAIDIAEKDFRGLVIGNEGANFSAGANLAMVFMMAVEQEFDEIDFAVRAFQNTSMRIRYSGIPVVVAPHGLTLGGGCEMSLHADKVQAAAETYIGLVEFGVGLIPGGGGSKEFTVRFADEIKPGDIELNLLRERFLTIGTAKVATSANEAFDMGVLRKGHDAITLNKERLLTDAKSVCLALAEAGYIKPVPRKDIRVLGKQGLGMIHAGANAMVSGHYMSEYDKHISLKLGYVMCGGELSGPTLVSEQYLLDLEREAFLSLCGEKKTLERIQSILTTGKPLRN